MSYPVLARVGMAATAFALAIAGAVVAAPKPAHAAEVTILDSTATWRYLDDGTDPASGNPAGPDAWAAPGFDDDAWRSARGSFGAINNQGGTLSGGFTPVTVLRQFGTGTQNIPVMYFRAEVNLTAAELAQAKTVSAEIRYDDAASLFVNGSYVSGGDDEALQPLDARNSTFGGSNASAPKLVTVSIPPTLLKAGSNTFGVRLHNGRQTSSDIYLDVVKVVRNSVGPATTSNVALTVGADGSERNLTWYSAAATGQVAQLAPTADLSGADFPESATTLTPSRSGLSNDSGKTFNQVKLADLKPGTTYSYRVGSPEAGWSPTYQFDTEVAGDFEFLFVGDPQIGSSGNNAADTAGWVKSMDIAREMFPKAKLLVAGGDQVETAANEANYGGLLQSSALAELAFSPTIGNHDVGAVSTYEQHFAIANKDADTRNNSFIWNRTLFLVLNSNVRDTSAHKAWMQAAIAEAGDKVDRKVVVMHHSIYSTASHINDSDILQRRAEFPSVFTELGINLVLAGHDHAYTRTHVMKNGTPVSSGQPKEVTPKQGEFLNLTGNSSSGSKYYSVQTQPAPFMSVQNQERIPNFTRVAVSQCSMSVGTYRSGDRSVVDAFTIRDQSVAPRITVPEVTQVAQSEVSAFDPMAGVEVSDPCESGLSATVAGEVGTQAGEYTLTYSVTDAYGNVVTADRVVKVTAQATPTVTATATVTATVTATATATATATVTATATATATKTVTMAPSAAPTATVTATAKPSTSPVVPRRGNQYDTPGFHRINGRDWMTTCEPYGATARCRTLIWATQLHKIDGRYVSVNGWVFNNLTYLESKAGWGNNPLAKTGAWVSADGRKWRTECGTALTGPKGCRTWVTATVHYKTPSGYATGTQWVLNNMVRLG